MIPSDFLDKPSVAQRVSDFHTDVLPLKDKIFRLALRITLDRQEAEDIVQETLIRMWQKRDEWARIQHIETYCLTICRHLALDYVKGEGARAKAKESIGSGTPTVEAERSSELLPDEMLDQKERIAAVRRLIDQLPEIQRTIIQLRDIEGMRYDEIGQVTGLSETQVKVYLHRARKRIRESL